LLIAIVAHLRQLMSMYVYMFTNPRRILAEFINIHIASFFTGTILICLMHAWGPKEPNILSKEPYLFYDKSLAFYKKSPLLIMRVLYSINRAPYYIVRALHSIKKALYSIKRAMFLSPIYLMNARGRGDLCANVCVCVHRR